MKKINKPMKQTKKMAAKNNKKTTMPKKRTKKETKMY